MRQGGLILAAGRVRSKKNRKKEKGPNPKHTTIYTAVRRPRPPRDLFSTKHVPRVSPYSPASIDPGFVEIGFVQLSQSEKTTNVTHTLTDTQEVLFK